MVSHIRVQCRNSVSDIPPISIFSKSALLATSLNLILFSVTFQNPYILLVSFLLQPVFRMNSRQLLADFRPKVLPSVSLSS